MFRDQTKRGLLEDFGQFRNHTGLISHYQPCLPELLTLVLNLFVNLQNHLLLKIFHSTSTSWSLVLLLNLSSEGSNQLFVGR